MQKMPNFLIFNVPSRSFNATRHDALKRTKSTEEYVLWKVAKALRPIWIYHFIFVILFISFIFYLQLFVFISFI